MNKLFLGKLDYVKEVHPHLIRDIFLNAEIRSNRRDYEIFEGDIQNILIDYLKGALANMDYIAKRESNGRFDAVIRNKNTNDVNVFYEVKTYIKKYEFPTDEEIQHDIEKLYEAISDNESKGYFILVIAKSKIKNKPQKVQDFIKKHVNDDRHWVDINDIKIRPSQKEKNGRLIVLSWEVKV